MRNKIDKARGDGANGVNDYRRIIRIGNSQNPRNLKP
jgi:hypothetical protein